VRRLLSGLAIVASGLALSACNTSGHSLEYQKGWNYGVALVEHARYIGASAVTAEATTCDQTASKKWPPVYGMVPPSKYPDYSQWDSGCGDAVSYVNGLGQRDLQIPFGPP
jgi:hypothetical protein